MSLSLDENHEPYDALIQYSQAEVKSEIFKQHSKYSQCMAKGLTPSPLDG